MTATAQLAVYDGREHMGSITEGGAKFRASGADGKIIGVFKNRKQALAAIEAKYRESNGSTS
jgi:hypothetical protein